MIRFLIFIECVLLLIVVADRIIVDPVAVPPPPAIAVDPPPPGAAMAQAPESQGDNHGNGASIAPGRRPVDRASSDAISSLDRLVLSQELLGPIVDTTAAMVTAAGGANAGDELLPTGRAAETAPAAAGPALSESIDDGAGARRLPGSARSASKADAVPAAEPESVAASRRGEEEAQPRGTRVIEAQRLLSRLGYQPGAADGTFGKRTEAAVRAYQRHIGERDDGRLSAHLLSRMQQDVRELADRDRVGASGARTGAANSSDSQGSPGFLAKVVGGYQRLVGHRFDSIRRPAEVRTYCGSQPDTWIYDEGHRDLIYCGRVIAAHRNR